MTRERLSVAGLKVEEAMWQGMQMAFQNGEWTLPEQQGNRDLPSSAAINEIQAPDRVQPGRHLDFSLENP